MIAVITIVIDTKFFFILISSRELIFAINIFYRRESTKNIFLRKIYEKKRKKFCTIHIVRSVSRLKARADKQRLKYPSANRVSLIKRI